MYAPSYGFGPGSNSHAFNPNGAPQQAHNPHQQLQQQQQQQTGQQPQMYNSQQYAAPGPHQSPYGGGPGPGPGMGPNASGMGMMQNSGLAHMAGGHVASYQTPYSSSPYGTNLTTSTSSSGANLPPNFMPTTSGAPSFPMNLPNMNPQQMQAQRMQPPPQSSTPTQPGQRASPYGGMPHNTPPNAANAQSRFTQNANQAHLQTSNNPQQNQAGTVVTPQTPQTPNFPPGSQGAMNTGAATVTPMSPVSEAREKDRVTLLLEINRELLLEVMRLQAAQQAEKAAEKKEESAANTNLPNGMADKDKADKDKAQKSVSAKEYFECMRRLQGNLAYLAAIADRSHKPSSQIPPHPAVMSAPPLSSRTKKDSNSIFHPLTDETKLERSEDTKPEDTSIEAPDENPGRVSVLQDQYKRLQALFPGVDPKKDAQAQSNAAARAQMQAKQQAAQAQAQAQAQMNAQGLQGQGGEQTPQQKMQNDLYRQRMMQQAQQQQSMLQNQSQGQGQNQ